MQVTMMDTTSNSNPYEFVSNQKQAKKACTDHAEQEELTTASICITFKKPMKSGTEINVAATVKQLFSTMKSANPHLTILALNCQALFCPNNDEFPTNKVKFKQFFLVHPIS